MRIMNEDSMCYTVCTLEGRELCSPVRLRRYVEARGREMTPHHRAALCCHDGSEPEPAVRSAALFCWSSGGRRSSKKVKLATVRASRRRPTSTHSERGHERHAERFQWGHVSTFMVLFVVSRLLFSDTSQKLLLLLLCVLLVVYY